MSCPDPGYCLETVSEPIAPGDSFVDVTYPAEAVFADVQTATITGPSGVTVASTSDETTAVRVTLTGTPTVYGTHTVEVVFEWDCSALDGYTPPGASNDPDAIHDDIAGEINLIAEKVSPVNADLVIIEDSADGNAKKKVQVGNLPGGVGGGGDQWGDPVNADIIPDADGVHDLGNNATRFAEMYTDALDVTNNLTVGGLVEGRDISVDGTKLDTIETSATADQSAAEILAALLTVDGTGTLLDADLLDGQEAAAFAAASHTHAGEDITSGTVAAARLGEMTGDSGAGGAAGAVPAPAAGDAAAEKFFKADGTWTAPSGSGDVVGPASATDNNLATFDGVTGKLLQDGGVSSASFATAAQGATADSALQPADIDTLAEINAIIGDATLIDTADARLSDDRDPTAHAAEHTDGTDDIQDATAGQKGLATATQITKLDGIEALADVTDATNVNAAGAVMESDISGTPSGSIIDDDTLATASNTTLATSESIKAYVDGAVTSQVTYQGAYDASGAAPTASTVGEMYTVTVAGTGTGYFSTALEIGDVIISESASPASEADWTVVNKDLDAASIKTSYESNADTNAYDDAAVSKLAGIEASATADQSAAEILAALLTVDGAGTLLDADLLDGQEAAAFAAASHTHVISDVTDNHAASTGLLTGGVLSTGAGAAEYSISDGTGVVVTAAGAITDVSWTGESNRTPANIASALLTWVSVNSAGTIVERTSALTSTEFRSEIFLGVIVHTDLATVQAVNNEQVVAYQPVSSLQDLADAVGFVNVSGNVFSGNGVNLSIDKSAGVMFKMGGNYDQDSTNPHNRTIAANTLAQFQYRFSDGTSGPLTDTLIDPDNLDDGAGGTTAVTNNRWSVQRIYIFLSGNIKLQRGVEDFATKALAIEGISSENYVTENSISENGLLRGWLVVKKGATDLTDGTEAQFIAAPKFGEGAVGGASTPAGDAQDVVISALKSTAGTITAGSAVRATGYSAGNLLIELADADAAGEMPGLGIARGTITQAAAGTVIFSGVLEGIDTSTYSVNDSLYVSATAGALTATRPTGAATGIQSIARVLSVDAATGVIQVTGAGRVNDLPNLTADTLWYGDGSAQPVETTITSFARTVLDDATAADARTTLGAQEDISGATLTGATVATGDKVLVQDVDDTDNLKTVTAQSIADLATHTPEGTAVLSTGEVGGVKFLREDGDGTCSWQTPAGAGDVSDGDTLSTGLTFPNTGLHVLDTNASHDLILKPNSDLTADRTLNLTTGDADRTLTINADTTLGGGSHSGTNTGDEAAASVTVAGIAEIATSAEIDTGTDDTRTISPLGLAGSQLQTDVTANNAKVTNANHTGDVTGDTALTIAADSVTYDKMQDTSGTDVLLGRSTAGAGTVEEITCTAFARTVLDDADAATVRATIGAGTGTLSNVVEDTTPQLGGQLDINGQAIGDGTNELLTFVEDASAVNHVEIENEATGSGPIIRAAGDDAAVDLNLAAKGTGNIALGNFTLDADQTVGAGQDNYVLTYDNAGGLISLEAATGGGISNVSEDTTPSLGGTLDGDGFDIIDSGVLTQREQAAAEADVAGAGQWWTQTATPNLPMFTDDAGNDGQVVTDFTTVFDHIYVNAGAMIPRTTNGATSTTTELATNDVMVDTMEFVTGTEQGVGFWVTFPPGWDTSVSVQAKFHWTTIAGAAGGVTWGIAGQSFTQAETMDAAMPASVDTDDTWETAGDAEMHISPISGAITITGAAAGEPVYFEVTRVVGDANDTMNADAGLMGVQLEFGRTVDLATAL